MGEHVVLHGLLPQEVEALWPEFWRLLARANEFDPSVQIEEAATRAALKESRLAGFYETRGGSLRMALTMEFKNTERGVVADITALGGDEMQDWLAGIDSIAAWAKDKGCKYLSASGRPGWERVLKDKGFRRVAITVEKAL